MTEKSRPVIDEKKMIESFVDDSISVDELFIYEDRKDSVPGTHDTVPDPDQNKRKKGKGMSYENLFIRPSSIVARGERTACIRAEYHRTIKMIVQASGEPRISIADYLDHVLAHHFEMFEKEMEAFYAANYKPLSIFKKPK